MLVRLGAIALFFILYLPEESASLVAATNVACERDPGSGTVGLCPSATYLLASTVTVTGPTMTRRS